MGEWIAIINSRCKEGDGWIGKEEKVMNDDALPDAGMQDCKGKELFKQVFFFFFFFFLV